MDNNSNEPTSNVISNMLESLRSSPPDNGTMFALQEDSTESIGSSIQADPAPNAEPVSTDSSDVLELGDAFDYSGFQVVRREFFAHMNEPSITFNNYKVYVNTACINRFSEVNFVQALVNSSSQILAIRPCREDERDAFAWCTAGSGKRKPRQITCRLFFAKVFSLMGWNPDHRYKLLGRVIHANDEYLIAFDMTATEVYQRVFKDGEKPKTSRTPVFPIGWQNQFGLSFKEHRQSMQIDIFDGYAVYGIKDNGAAKAKPELPEEPSLNLAEPVKGSDV